MAFESDSKQLQSYFDESFVLAKNALTMGEVPIACLFVNSEGTIVARDTNCTNDRHNGFRHAEIQCIDAIVNDCNKSSQSFADVFRNCHVIVTVEPCIMCARILRHLRVRKVIYGAANQRFGGCGTVMSVHNDKHIDDPPLECVINTKNSQRSVQLLQEFYDGQNPNAPKPKLKKLKRI